MRSAWILLAAALALPPVRAAAQDEPARREPAAQDAPAAQQAPAAPAPDEGTVYTINGSGAELLREGSLYVTKLNDAVLTSDSLRIVADRAESYRDDTIAREEVFLYGSVVAEDGATRIAGDEGYYNRPAMLARVSGNVSILDGETTIHCDEAQYARLSQEIVLTGAVVIEQPGSRIEAQRVIYHRATGFAEAHGQVVAHDLDEGTVMRGEHGTFDRQRGVAVMDEQPKLLTVEDGDTIQVWARRMLQNRLDSVAVAVGEVHYRRGEMDAYCDSALYHQNGQRMRLYGSPRVLREGSELRGDSLDLVFAEGQLRAMDVQGSARFLDAPADPRVFPDERGEISGRRFRILFEDGKIRDVEVQGEPKSIYIPEVEEDGRASRNTAQGDSMLLRFSRGQLEEVRIFGNARGEYRYLDGWRQVLAGADSLDGPARFDDLASAIQYRSRDIIYESKEERVYLQGEAEAASEEFTLQATNIRFDAGDDYLDARGAPVLIEKEERLFGELMEYAIDRQEGLVHAGATRYGDGFYSGERLKRTPDGSMHVVGSSYTTCELSDPHYHFSVDRMTIRIRDKIVGAPVRFYLGDVPLFYLPYIFNNLARGRRSGFLQPDFEFGITLNEGKPQRFIRDLGYYVAISDYADLLLQGDYVEPRRRTAEQSAADGALYGTASYQYYRRYFLNGSIRSTLRYDIRNTLPDDTRSWGLRGSHEQSLGERTLLNARVDFVSSEEVRDIQHHSLEEVVDQRLNSSAGFSRKWDRFSLNTSYTRTQILNQRDDDPATDNLLLDETIPLSLATTAIPLWPGGGRHGGVRGVLAGLKLRPAINYNRNIRTTEETRATTESASTGTSLGTTFKLGFLSLNPKVNVSEKWDRSPSTETVYSAAGKGEGPDAGAPLPPAGEAIPLNASTIDVSGDSQTSSTWSASASASTRLYGVFTPRLGGLTGIRHTAAPSVGWSYGESRGRRFSLSRNMSFSLDNSLDLKFGEGDKVVRKTGLVTWGLRTGLDLTRDDKPWSSLSSSLRFSPADMLSAQLGHSYDLNTGRKTYTSFSGSLNLRGSFRYGRVERVQARENIVSEREAEMGQGGRPADQAGQDEGAGGIQGSEWDLRGGRGGGFDPLAPLGDAPGGGTGQPFSGSPTWNLGLSYSLNRTPSSRPSPSLSVSGGLQLTENWRLDYRTNLSLEDGRLGSQSVDVTRDLHCWAASFSRLVYQGQEQYYFRIFLKAHPEDIKIESGERGLRY